MNPSIFNFNNHGVRVALDANGQPLFCLPDVGQALDIKNATASRFKLNPKGYMKCIPLQMAVLKS